MARAIIKRQQEPDQDNDQKKREKFRECFEKEWSERSEKASGVRDIWCSIKVNHLESYPVKSSFLMKFSQQTTTVLRNVHSQAHRHVLRSLRLPFDWLPRRQSTWAALIAVPAGGEKRIENEREAIGNLTLTRFDSSQSKLEQYPLDALCTSRVSLDQSWFRRGNLFRLHHRTKRAHAAPR